MGKRKFQSTMEMFVKSKGEKGGADGGENTDSGMDIRWRREGDVLWGTTKNLEKLFSEKSKFKVASYDADGTLVDTVSGKPIARHANDWRILSATVPRKLSDEHEDGAMVVIFTNQAGIRSNYTPEGMIRLKFEGIVKRLGVPCAVFVSCDYGLSRKPAMGMWDLFMERLGGNLELDLSSSFYVGDAAGRKPTAAKKKGDFSDSDRKFALNVGLKFFTPEEYFDGDGDASVRDLPVAGFNPFSNREWKKALDPPDALDSLKSDTQQLIVLIGRPGAGKSTFCIRELQPLNVVRVNRDTLGSMPKCIAAATSALDRGESVAIDNTNPSLESRRPYISLAKEKGILARAFVFQTPRDLAMHLNRVRCNVGKGRLIPSQAYAMYDSGYRPPELQEGFQDVVHVHFRPLFEDGREEFAFKQWT